MNLNDQVVAYLASKNITPNQGDFQTVSKNGIESISIWNTSTLGAQPTSDQLQEAYLSWQLQQAKEAQNQTLYNAYQSAIQDDVSYTTVAGISKTYQADFVSQDALVKAMLGYKIMGQVPANSYWVSADNTQVQFSLDDFQGLYLAMLANGKAAFDHLQMKKALVKSATTASQILAIVW
jgi:Domain of unknown function (DUF4376)